MRQELSQQTASLQEACQQVTHSYPYQNVI